MRALLGYILALALFAAPAMAGTNGPDDRGSAAGSDSSSAAKSDAATQPDASSTESELEELRVLLESQATQLQEQNDQLKTTQQKIEALEKKLKAASASAAASPAPVSTAPALASGTAVAYAPTIASPSESSSSSSVAIPAASGTASNSNNTNEPKVYGLPPTYGTNPALPEPQGRSAVGTEESPLSFRIGGADFTPGGFIDLTNVFRTKDNGGGIGTSFGSIPYLVAPQCPAACSTEDRFSLQNSRISLRVDSTVFGGKAVGYIETDFLGNAAPTLNVTSNSATLRLRVYFLDYRRGHWEFLGGQDWSMLTSNRTGIGFMPADVFNSQDMDTNYQLGLAWERTPQFRIVYHPNDQWALGFSMEDPDQYIGNGLVTLPSNVPTGFANQFDTNGGSGGTGPGTPNLLPDIVAKIAFDPMISGKHMHIEGVGLARTFRAVNYTNPSGSTVALGPSNKVEGGAVALNSNWEIFKNFHLIENAFWSDGGGRELFGIVPDFIIRPTSSGASTFTLSPIHAGSFIGGFEYQATPKWFVYGYYSGIYVDRNTGFVGTTPYGYGFTPVGSVTSATATAEADNRWMYEPTLGIIPTIWRNPQYGALQFITQVSYLQRDPWYVVSGTPRLAQNFMAWVDLRYTLP